MRSLLSVVAFLLIIALVACNQVPTIAPVPGTQSAAITPTPAVTNTPPSATVAVDTPPPAPTIEVDEEKLSGLKVRFWHPWSGPTGDAIQSLVAAFNAENEYGIIVESAYQGNYNDLYAKIDAAIQAGNPPSLAVGYVYQIQAWDASPGIVTDLAPYINDPGWGLSPAEQADFNLTFWQQEVIAGKRIGFPAQRSAQLIYYNLTWAKELGFASPPTTSE